MDEEVDFYYSNWDQLKRVKEQKRCNGQTYRSLMDCYRKDYNRSHLFSYEIHSRLHSRKERQILENKVSFMNLNNTPTTDNWVTYSLNKKKRWLLPEMFETKAREETLENDYDLEVYYNSLNIGLYPERFTGYIDNRGVDLTNRSGVKIYSKTLLKTRYNPENQRRSQKRTHLESRRKNSVNIGKYEKRKHRIAYKNGNRDRNSGIKRRNETFLQENDDQQNNQTKGQIRVGFRIPTPIYENRWPRTTRKRFPIANDQCYIYSRRLRRKGWFTKEHLNKMKKKLRRLAKIETAHEIDDLKADFEAMKTEKVIFDRVDDKNIRKVKRKRFDFKEFIVKKINKQTKSIKPQNTKISNEFPHKNIIYIDSDKNEKDEKIDITDSSISSIPNNPDKTTLFDIKASVTNSFSQSIRDLLESSNVSIVIESDPKLVLVKIDNSGSILFFKHDNYIIDNTFEFTLNPRIKRSDIDNFNESLDLEGKIFDTIQDLLLLIKSHLELYSNWAIRAKRPKNGQTLIGLNTSREFKSIVNEIKEELSINGDVVMEINTSSTDFTCPICFDDVKSIGTVRLSKCGHWACKNCWQSYLNTRLANFTTSHRIECLYEKCESILTENLLLTLVSASLVDSYFDSYSRMRLLKSGYRFCSSLNCDGVIQLRSNGDDDWPSTLRCSCGVSICRRCLADAHFPASCEQAKRYRVEVAAANVQKPNVDDKDLYESEGKNCPSCHLFYEKNGGCNHMTCPCGIMFCWVCLKNLSDHTKCEKPAAFVKYDRLYFLEPVRKSCFAGRFGAIILKETYNREKYKENYWKLKFKARRFGRILWDENPNSKEISAQYFSIGYDNLVELTYLNEYFALLLKNSKKKKFQISGNYSFVPNIKKSLRLSIQIEKDLEGLIFEGESVDDFKRLVLLVNRVKKFVNNLKHILNNFEIN